MAPSVKLHSFAGLLAGVLLVPTRGSQRSVVQSKCRAATSRLPTWESKVAARELRFRARKLSLPGQEVRLCGRES